MELENKIRITIVGAVPRPVGGVSVFIYRLAHKIPDIISEIIDLYPADGKYSIPSEID